MPGTSTAALVRHASADLRRTPSAGELLASCIRHRHEPSDRSVHDLAAALCCTPAP